MELIVDEEFKNLLPRLSSEEYFNLEQQIKKDGVLNPIITWKGIIVDGHNRYAICKANDIAFPIKEKEFVDRDGVIEWILRHQLGRRNLTDFQRNEIALRYEEVIARKAKERMTLGSIETRVEEKGRTSEKLGKIAGTSRPSIERTKLILNKGTPEQIKRARKGGHELDGRSNAISAIAKEISNKVETKVCDCCKRTLPITEFYLSGKYHRNTCKKCFNFAQHSTDLKGNRNKSVDIGIGEEELYDMLYNEDREVEFTIDDLIEEISVNGDSCIQGIQLSIQLHEELLKDKHNKKKINDLIDSFIKKIKNIKES